MNGPGLTPKTLSQTNPVNIALIIGLLVTLVACLFLCQFLFKVIMPQPNPPPDRALIEHYLQHQADFNQLATLLVIQDNHFNIFPDTDKCQVGEKLLNTSDNALCAELARYFKLLNLDAAGYAGNQPLWLPVYNWGLGVSGFDKGYAYSTKETWIEEWGSIVESTEEPCIRPCFRKIDTSWYIYVDSS